MELNQANFRRLVQLHLLLFGAFFIVGGYEYFNPTWSRFSSAFDALVEEQFGTIGDRVLIPLALLCLASLVGSLAAAIGLLKFHSWARWGFWIFPLLVVPMMFVPGTYPYYTTPLYDLLAFADTALFGCILAIAYSPEHGGRWFAPPIKTERD